MNDEYDNINEKYINAYRLSLEGRTEAELRKILTRDQLIMSILDCDPTGLYDAEFEDIRASL